jgi:DNA invertase Pin-like site-specific DNA recombinase
MAFLIRDLCGIRFDSFSLNFSSKNLRVESLCGAADAYQMISTLRRLGVEPQAVEQPLDLSIPENKMMLAFYLATPEVEIDRRALNTFHGMRRSKKEGRWMHP